MAPNLILWRLFPKGSADMVGQGANMSRLVDDCQNDIVPENRHASFIFLPQIFTDETGNFHLAMEKNRGSSVAWQLVAVVDQQSW